MTGVWLAFPVSELLVLFVAVTLKIREGRKVTAM